MYGAREDKNHCPISINLSSMMMTKIDGVHFHTYMGSDMSKWVCSSVNCGSLLKH